MMYSYKNSKVLFHGKRVDVLSIDNGEKELVDHPGAVVILPMLDEETVILIRNERRIVQETLWELPAGTLEKNESIEACAVRELSEETGYRANRIEYLSHFFSTPGFCNEKLFAFYATDLTYIGQKLDASEKIEVVILPMKEVLEMIKKGEICDAKTIATLFFYQLHTKKNN